MAIRQRNSKTMEIKITQQKDGRYFAQYLNPNEIVINGIGQFGETAFEAEVNLIAVLRSVRREMNKTTVLIAVS